MVEYFQQGGSYNAVNYGEYVIIDTIVNDNHYGSPENGIIYRRGLDFNEAFNPNNTQNNEILINENGTISKEDVYPEDYFKPELIGKKIYYIYSEDQEGNQILTFNEEKYKSTLSAFVQRPGGGAEYVGQIVGPQGEAPELSLIHWDEFLEKYQDPAAADVNKNSFIVNPPAGAEFDEETGDVVEESIKDTIDYGYLDIKDADGNITGAYISLNIPYSVFRYHAESIEPYEPQEGETHFAIYDDEQGVWKYTNLITEDQDSEGHNYFWQYDIKVPKGIRGQDLQEFGININPELETGDNVETQDWIDPDTGEVLEEDINYRYYRIYRNYEKSAEGEPTKEYINSWQKTIHKITDNGYVPNYPLLERNADYSVGDRVAANGLRSNLFLIATTDGTTGSESLPALQMFDRGRTFEDGTVTWQVFEDTVVSPSALTIHYTHDGNENIAIKLLDDIIIDQENGKIYAKYSNPSDSLVYLGENQSIIAVDYIDTPWIDPAGVRHTIDRLRIKYNTYNYDENGKIITNPNYSLDSQGNIIYPTTDREGHRIQFIDEQFKFLDRIETILETKDVIAYYNDGTTSNLGKLRAIQDVYVTNEDDLGKPKYWAVQYNNQLSDGTYQTDYINQHPLNQVACIQQYGDNIILLYSDPNVRQSLYRAGIDYAIPNTYAVPNYQLGSGDDDHNGNLYWINLGSIYHSNHVFGNFDSLDQLQHEYPFGFDKDSTGQLVPQYKDHAGWLATITDSQTGAVSIYAYDYRSGNGWYPLADMSASAINPEWSLIVSKPGEGSNIPPADKKDLLQIGGYWFVISERAD